MRPNIQQAIENQKKTGLYRSRKIIESAQGARVIIDGRSFINFCSNDYLGLANNQVLKSMLVESLDVYGIGAGSSQLLTGHFLAHRQLEQKLATFFCRDSALVFSSGYLANLAISSAFMDRKTVVLQDKLNHASLVDSALLSKAKLIRYAHNDINALSSFLAQYRSQPTLVMTDGIFSMDGDCALLRDIATLCKHYNALLIVDDAHGVGVLGSRGAGVLEELGLDQSDVPLLIGTFGKSFGGCGAFISGESELIDVCLQKARTYIYTTAPPPSIAEIMTKAVDIVAQATDYREKLKKLIAYYLLKVKNFKQPLQSSGSHIQPFILGDIANTLKLSERLYECGILANAICPPTVPEGTSRLRFSFTANHTEQHIDRLLACLHDYFKK